MSDLHQRMESMVMTIKHYPEGVDLEEVRVLLRNGQQAVELLDRLTEGSVSIMEADSTGGYATWRITTSCEAQSSFRAELLSWMSGEQ